MTKLQAGAAPAQNEWGIKRKNLIKPMVIISADCGIRNAAY